MVHPSLKTGNTVTLNKMKLREARKEVMDIWRALSRSCLPSTQQVNPGSVAVVGTLDPRWVHGAVLLELRQAIWNYSVLQGSEWWGEARKAGAALTCLQFFCTLCRCYRALGFFQTGLQIVAVFQDSPPSPAFSLGFQGGCSFTNQSF